MTPRTATFALFASLSLAGCLAPTAPPAASAPWTRTELYFGLTRADGTAITDAEWDKFVQTAVTPRFPAGFTVVAAEGHFGSADQAPHREPARVLILFHDAMAADDVRQDTNRRIDAVAHEFATRFEQESVLRVDGAVRARFLTTRAASPARR